MEDVFPLFLKLHRSISSPPENCSYKDSPLSQVQIYNPVPTYTAWLCHFVEMGCGLALQQRTVWLPYCPSPAEVGRRMERKRQNSWIGMRAI